MKIIFSKTMTHLSYLDKVVFLQNFLGRLSYNLNHLQTTVSSTSISTILKPHRKERKFSVRQATLQDVPAVTVAI